ncbi:MAG: prepilin-type N-terminal cleavage/methylation domain-containing protein [Chloroflexi bacterium]|nr:prepilin-type N-terminal cleavage/methylation domain-containing protein [Chloroflexota bacterium]
MKYQGSLRSLSLHPKCPVRAKGTSWFGGLAASGGFTMVEIVVSIVVLSVASVALAGALSTGYLGYRVLEKDMTALNLATAQMEYTKGPDTDYKVSGCYDTITPPEGYGITACVEYVDGRPVDQLQRIVVKVTRNDVEVRTLEDYKANR